MEFKPEIQIHSIVFLGDFNPKIFQPAWFALEEIIGKKEAENADIKIVHPEIVVFKLDWFELQVTRERYLLATAQEAYNESLRDLAISTFKLLNHTPITRLGINFDYHYSMRNPDDLHTIFSRLAPRKEWEGILENPTFQGITFSDMHREKINKGYYRVKIEPSIQAANGLYIQCNDHYEIEDLNKPSGASEMINILEKNWAVSQDKSKNIINKLVKK